MPFVSIDAALRNLMKEIDEEIKSEQDSFDKLFKDKLKKNIC